ncbi:hypothetical protein C0J52_04323, partial [Blattella germanica]
ICYIFELFKEEWTILLFQVILGDSSQLVDLNLRKLAFCRQCKIHVLTRDLRLSPAHLAKMLSFIKVLCCHNG